MAFDYEAQTKKAYTTTQSAHEYQRSYSDSLRWTNLRFHFIARREREVARSLLRRITPKTVLDIPCGAGKMATVFREIRCKVVGADISPEMLPLAQRSYDDAGIESVSMVRSDAEDIAECLGTNVVDAVFCLRLMHRVPRDIRTGILRQFSQIARFTIVSFGVDSPYLRMRKRLRNMAFGGGIQELCLASLGSLKEEVQVNFRIVETRWVARFLSEEIMFLLEAKQHSA